MPPKSQSIPKTQTAQQTKSPEETLRPYEFHGLDIRHRPGQAQALATCPFCTREGKFTINVERGVWRCLVCNEGKSESRGGTAGGNIYTFMRLVWQRSMEATKNDKAYDELAAERGLLTSASLRAWGVCKSIITGEWLIPGYGVSGEQGNNLPLNQLWKYSLDRKSGKRRCYATPGTNLQMVMPCGSYAFDKKKPDVFLCEGHWDPLALWEVIQHCKMDDKSLTANQSLSILSETNVIGIPGCGGYNEAWNSLFVGKNVFLLFDNDHPREHPITKAYIPPAAYEGMKRIAQILGSPSNAAHMPKSIHYLEWSADGGEYEPSLKGGYDLRDALTSSKELPGRVKLLNASILKRIQPVPTEWVHMGAVKSSGGSGGETPGGSTELECMPCDDWRVLQKAWREAMHWTEGLDRAFSFMLACVISTKALGDQLWGKVIGPASCGKSTLCEALSINRKYIKALSTMRGFHSGFQTDRGGEEDNSLIPQIKDKTLVIKDGDTLMKSPNVAQILSEARDIYDKVARADYRNTIRRSYEGICMTWILCGTNSLRSIDSSELGERFLDCVIMDGIDDELEDAVLWKVVQRAHKQMSYESDGAPSTHNDPTMTRVMQLTGGYINHLRVNAQRLLDSVKTDNETLRQIMSLGKFVAFMRARPSTENKNSKSSEKAEREFGSRLVSQLMRLAQCMAAVLGEETITPEVMRRVKRTAMDTSRGNTLDICRELYNAGETGTVTDSIRIGVHMTAIEVNKLLLFLTRIGAAEVYVSAEANRFVKQKVRFRLTPKLRKLYTIVMTEKEGE